jgi:uncharacterized pyridoxamine 5'-phosphate oxidase family protein
VEKVLKFLDNNPVFYFATTEGDQPRVRPLGFHMKYDNRLYFGIGTHKKSFQQILKNPKVEICTASAESEWIRISGKVVVDNRPEIVDDAFKIMPNLKKIYNEKSGLKIGTFYLENAEAEFFNMTGKYEKVSF